MNYDIEKLRNASTYIKQLSDDLENDLLSDTDKIQAEADLVSHIERLLIVAHILRGVKVDLPKIQAIISLI